MSVLHSTHEFGIRPGTGGATRRRGFTAIEMVAVATIMVILSLILVINVRKRVDDSKIAAAKEEMNELGKIESEVFGETGHFFPLQDLDNTPNIAGVTGTDMPMAYFGGTPTTITQFVLPTSPLRTALMESSNPWNTNPTWQGPYTQFKKYITLGDLAGLKPELFYDPNRGPIYAEEATPTVLLDPSDKYPLDPWGNPYIFEVLVDNQGKPYGGRIYSLGPDGLPGPTTLATPPPPAPWPAGSYYHTHNYANPTDVGMLGIPGQTGDDLVLNF